jgi:hypothetical protein
MGWYHSADWEDFAKAAAEEQAVEAALAAARSAAAASAASANTRAAPAASTSSSASTKKSGITACPLPRDETPPPPPPDVETIFHLCQKSNWDAAYHKKEPYFPPTFLQDGKFTRATVYKEDIVPTANEYYKNTPGEWICLELNVKVLYGLGIPILAQIAPESTKDTPVKCLQVFGGINTTLPSLLQKVYPMKRAANGEFLAVLDPPDCGCGPAVAATTAKKTTATTTTANQPQQSAAAKNKSSKPEQAKEKSGMGSWFKKKSSSGTKSGGAAMPL